MTITYIVTTLVLGTVVGIVSRRWIRLEEHIPALKRLRVQQLREDLAAADARLLEWEQLGRKTGTYNMGTVEEAEKRARILHRLERLE